MPHEDRALHRFEFDLRVFALETIQKAAYRYTGHYTVQFESLIGDRVLVILSPLPQAAGKGPVTEDLPNEVLDQHLRQRVATETQPLRDLILAQAFSSLALIDPDGEKAEFRDDPKAIASPSSPRVAGEA